MTAVPSFDAVEELINGGNGTWSKAKGLLEIALKIAPGLLLGGFNVDLTNLDISGKNVDVKKILENVQTVWNRAMQLADCRSNGFECKYEKYRLANTWLILAAYFDTIRIHHESLWNAIDLQPIEAQWLVETIKESYHIAKDIFGEDGRGVLSLTDNGMSKLEEYYRLLNNSTALFAEGLEKPARMKSDWDAYPSMAIKCYKKEMFALCGTSQEFFAWTGAATLVEILNGIDEIKEGQYELITLVRLLIDNSESNIPRSIKNEFCEKYKKHAKSNGIVLSDDEIKIVRDFAEKIDVENTSQILQYGSATQKKMVDLSDAALNNVRTVDLGETGKLIENVIQELKDFDVEEKKGLFGFFRKQINKLELMKSRFAKAETNVAKIGEALEKHQLRLMKDSTLLDSMYKQNLAYFKELTMYILAGKKKLAQIRSGKLAELQAKAQLSGLAEDAQAARDLSDKCDRFEKKIHDLELTRAISIQTASQIRMIQNNDNVMVEKIQTTQMNTIPLWKTQMMLAISAEHSLNAAATQKQVSDITNALLKQNAERLHMASVETAKEAERGIVDIETLKATNAKLIQTFDDVMKIQADGRAKRLAAEAEMVKMENDLKQKLLQIRNGN